MNHSPDTALAKFQTFNIKTTDLFKNKLYSTSLNDLLKGLLW